MLDSHSITNKAGKEISKAYIFLVFLISPFLSLVVALRNYKTSWAKNILWAFVVFYGYTLVISNEGIDANRYRDNFLKMHRSNLTWENFTQLLYTEDSNIVDLLQPILTLIVSQITGNYHVLFAVFALVFGYFYSRNIFYLIEQGGKSIKKENIIIIFTFAILVGFWKINGFRFWTATHVFLFGALPYVFKRDKSKLWIAFLSVFIHFSFFLPLIILFSYMLLGNRRNIFFILFMISFFVSEIELSAVREISTAYLPDFLHGRVEGYTNVEYAEGKQSLNRTWHIVLFGRALKYALITFILLIYFNGKKVLKVNENLNNLFCFSLFFSGLANILSSIPSMGRFLTLANLFMVASVFFYIQFVPKSNIFQKIYPFAFAGLLFFCIVAFRLGMDTIGVVTIIGNPLSVFFVDSEIALIELVK